MERHKPHVVVVGSSNTDMVVNAPQLPTPGQTVSGDAFFTAAGGKGANQAVAAARLGGTATRVTFLGAFGDDELGTAASRSLIADGIDCRYITSIKKCRSGVALIFVGGSGENMIVVAPGANAKLTPAHMKQQAKVIRSADVLLVQLETPLKTVAMALSLAKEAGVKTILNPAPAPAKKLPASLLKNVDLLTPNETEFEAITGVRPTGPRGEKAARAMADSMKTGLIITLGSAGVRVLPRGEKSYQVRAHKVKAVDTVAAGDAFSGALALALAEGRELPAAVEFASAAAAISVTRQGAQPSLPKRTEVTRLMRGKRRR